MSRHTPGRWWQAIHDDAEIRSKYGIVATVAIPDASPETGEANARLIAAAPDLLEFAAWIAGMSPEGELGRRARTAIAKATGSQVSA